jgi:signal peptidase I
MDLHARVVSFRSPQFFHEHITNHDLPISSRNQYFYHRNRSTLMICLWCILILAGLNIPESFRTTLRATTKIDKNAFSLAFVAWPFVNSMVPRHLITEGKRRKVTFEKDVTTDKTSNSTELMDSNAIENRPDFQ